MASLYVKYIYPIGSRGQWAQGRMLISTGMYQTGIYDSFAEAERVLDEVEARDRAEEDA